MEKRRSSRVVVPEVEPPAEASPEMVIPEDPPTLDLAFEQGDIAELGQSTYQDWNWYVYRHRTPEEMTARGPRGRVRTFVTKIVGPIDVNDFQARFGGGVFEFWGFFQGTLRKREMHEIEGPRKTYDPLPSPPSPPAPPAPHPNGPDPMIERLMERLDRMEQRISGAGTVTQGLTLKDVLQLIPLLQHQGTPPDVSMVKEMTGLLRDGFQLHADLAGKAEPNNTVLILEKLAPVLENVLKSVAARRVPRPIARAASAVVEESPPEPQVTGISTDDVLQTAMVDALARAIAEGVDPGDFAATVEHLLQPQQLAMIRMGSAEQVMAELRKTAERYPIFTTESASSYVEAVLTELKSSPDSSS